jgi:tetratricopeptide (TPR) repeat protein
MNENAKINHFLAEIKPKVSAGTLSEEEKVKLKSIVQIHPCHLDANLLLLKAAWSHQHDPDPGFEPWTDYYLQALKRESECWNNDQMIKLYNAGGELALYDEEKEFAAEAALNAYNRDPDNWSLLITYISVVVDFPPLPEDEIISLVRHVIPLESDNESLKHYYLGTIYERLAKKYRKSEYKKEAFRYYESALTLGLKRTHPGLACGARKAPERLKEI